MTVVAVSLVNITTWCGLLCRFAMQMTCPVTGIHAVLTARASRGRSGHANATMVTMGNVVTQVREHLLHSVVALQIDRTPGA